MIPPKREDNEAQATFLFRPQAEVAILVQTPPETFWALDVVVTPIDYHLPCVAAPLSRHARLAPRAVTLSVVLRHSLADSEFNNRGQIGRRYIATDVVLDNAKEPCARDVYLLVGTVRPKNGNEAIFRLNGADDDAVTIRRDIQNKFAVSPEWFTLAVDSVLTHC